MSCQYFKLRRTIRKRRDIMSSISLGISQTEKYLSRLKDMPTQGKSWYGYELALKRLQLQFDAFCRKSEIVEFVNIRFLLQLESDIHDLLGVIIDNDQVCCSCAAKARHNQNSEHNGTSDSSNCEPNIQDTFGFRPGVEPSSPSLISKFISLREVFKEFLSRIRLRRSE